MTRTRTSLTLVALELNCSLDSGEEWNATSRRPWIWFGFVQVVLLFFRNLNFQNADTAEEDKEEEEVKPVRKSRAERRRKKKEGQVEQEEGSRRFSCRTTFDLLR